MVLVETMPETTRATVSAATQESTVKQTSTIVTHVPVKTMDTALME